MTETDILYLFPPDSPPTSANLPVGPAPHDSSKEPVDNSQKAYVDSDSFEAQLCVPDSRKIDLSNPKYQGCGELRRLLSNNDQAPFGPGGSHSSPQDSFTVHSSYNNRSAEEMAPLERTLKEAFYKPDVQAIRIVLGTMEAHRLNLGDPAWLFVVAPPGSGKTTMSIMGASGLDDVRMLGDFTENAFLSGFYGHQTPGMLEKLGQTSQVGETYTTSGDAVLMAKDFTTVLSMRREKRGAILSQLREIHDGMLKRDFGTGVTKVWQGRITMIAAVTPVLDKYYGVFSVLGERFLQVRWHRPDSEEAGIRAIRQQGTEDVIRRKLSEIIKRVLENATKTPPTLPSAMQTRIASLAEIIAIGRTHVYRSSHGNRDIEFVPEPEANTRISKGLASIAKGIAAIQGRTVVADSDLQDVFRVGMDCLRDYRRQLFLAAAKGTDVDKVPLPPTMRTRELEELEALSIVVQNGNGYQLTEKFVRLWKQANVWLP